MQVESLVDEPDNDGPDTPDAIIDAMSRHSADDLSSLLVENLQALESAVDGLYRLGIAIRQSPSSNLTQRINAFVQNHDDGMLGDVVYIRLKYQLVDMIQRDSMPTNSNDEAIIPGASLSLCRQLAHSVTFRYFGILYRRNHARKLEIKREVNPPAERLKKRTASHTNPPVRRHEHPSSVQSMTTNPSPLPLHLRNSIWSSLSDTEPSVPNSDRIRHILASSHDEFESSSSIISIKPRAIKYPDPPRIDGASQRDQVCPYCCQRFPEAKYESKHWWE